MNQITTPGPGIDRPVAVIKKFRQDIDAQIAHSEYLLGINSQADDADAYFLRTHAGRELALVRTKLQEAKMWAGKVLEAVGNPFPAELADKAPVQ